MPADTLHAIGNRVEAAVWVILGLVSLLAGWRARGVVRRRWLLAGPVLVVFGLSDLVEVETGAWWRPWWLLLWKAVCVVVLIALGLHAWAARGDAKD